MEMTRWRQIDRIVDLFRVFVNQNNAPLVFSLCCFTFGEVIRRQVLTATFSQDQAIARP